MGHKSSLARGPQSCPEPLTYEMWVSIALPHRGLQLDSAWEAHRSVLGNTPCILLLLALWDFFDLLSNMKIEAQKTRKTGQI